MTASSFSSAELAAAAGGEAHCSRRDPAAEELDPSAADKQMPRSVDSKAMSLVFTDAIDGHHRVPMARDLCGLEVMSPENQAAMSEQCKQPESVKLKEFCGIYRLDLRSTGPQALTNIVQRRAKACRFPCDVIGFLDSTDFRANPRAMALDIKICGLKTDEAMAAALAGGASHVGFIFFAKSPRYVEPAEAGRLRQAALGKAKAVAVTVDAERRLSGRDRRQDAARHAAAARHGNARARGRGQGALWPAGDEGAAAQRGRRSRPDQALHRHRRPLPVRRQAAERLGTAGRQRRRLRLAHSCRP